MPMGNESANPAAVSVLQQYRGVEVNRVGMFSGAWALARWTLGPLMRRWIFWGLIALGMIGFLTNFAIIYIKAEIAVRNPQLAAFIDQFRVTGNGEAYRNFLFFQARAVELILAYFGVVALASDFRAGGMNFYLSKPMGRRTYVLGKMLAIAGVLSLLTVVPGLVLFIAYGLFSNSPVYWWDNLHLARGIVGYSVVIILVDGLVLMALASTLRKSASLLLVWSAIYVLMPALSAALEFQFRFRGFRLVNLWWDMGMIGAISFGSLQDTRNYSLLPWAFVVVVGVCAACGWMLQRNLRAVEIVS